MYNGPTTTRKGFLGKAGLALAGVLGLTQASASEAATKSKGEANARAGKLAERFKPARGAVERRS